ncbi:MAG: bifunctional pyr operon transcriptional regulator/uracil phosphoribosyltransferase PyrR [Actinobacteria bacterium]|nr:MAG: bifunctional pyr operon transcriptional regulator/uracil phosphoribosyltransferase PyrR [Actinomycetota bacterium]
MSGPDVERAISRIAHEIVERNHGTKNVVIVGLQRGGTWIADALGARILAIDPQLEVPVGSLDPTMHRDDIGIRPVATGSISDIPCDITGATVILVDDVLYTGRTVRAALEGLNNFGRPRAVQLAVLVDRGHRELPIRPDYVGKNLPTQTTDEVDVSAAGVIVSSGASSGGGR